MLQNLHGNCLKAAARVSAVEHKLFAKLLCDGKCQPGESSRIWGTVAMSVQACELTDNATRFNLATEISPFLHLCSGSDLPHAQILFAPSLAGGVYVPVLKPRQRIVCCAKLSMTKITGMEGLEGILMEPCRSRSVRLVCSALGIQQTVNASIPPLLAILSGGACPCLSFLILSRSCFHHPNPSSLSVVFLRYWSP